MCVIQGECGSCGEAGQRAGDRLLVESAYRRVAPTAYTGKGRRPPPDAADEFQHHFFCHIK